MNITFHPQPTHLDVVVQGRLDATWSERFLEVLRGAIRDGHHHLRVDAAGLEYLSSAGIRSLLQVHREVAQLGGSFKIRRASSFVAQTLSMSGFGQLIETQAAAAAADTAMPATTTESEMDVESRQGMRVEAYPLRSGATLAARHVNGWKPWQPVTSAPGSCTDVEFPAGALALGIGAPSGDGDDPRLRLGEFVAAAACAVYLPGDGSETPDYLLGAEQFVPKLAVLDALLLQGEFSHLLRFSPEQEAQRLTLESLAACVLERTRGDAAAFLAIAEIDGLVGAAMAKSPAHVQASVDPASFPEIRNWIAFCGERVYAADQALVVGVASRRTDHPLVAALPVIPSAQPGLLCHAHAAVFPFRPLPQGRIEPDASVRAVFEAGGPKAVLHLLDDDRPELGLGQSAFVRGACWCAALETKQEGRR